jgi:hypothetical protein
LKNLVANFFSYGSVAVEETATMNTNIRDPQEERPDVEEDSVPFRPYVRHTRIWTPVPTPAATAPSWCPAHTDRPVPGCNWCVAQCLADGDERTVTGAPEVEVTDDMVLEAAEAGRVEGAL